LAAGLIRSSFDSSYVPVDVQATALRKLGLPEATVQGMASGNAMKLVPTSKAQANLIDNSQPNTLFPQQSLGAIPC